MNTTQIIRGQRLLEDQLCVLHATTNLPLDIVYTHFTELREAMQRPGFSAGEFQKEALRQDGAAELLAQHDLNDMLRKKQIGAVGSGVAMFAVPLVGVYITSFAMTWAHRRVSALGLMRVGHGGLFVAAFILFWLANSEGSYPPFTDGQWRLLG